MVLKKRAKILLKILTNIGSKQMVGKKRAYLFKDSHEYREENMAGKNARKIFYNHNNVESKKGF